MVRGSELLQAALHRPGQREELGRERGSEGSTAGDARLDRPAQGRLEVVGRQPLLFHTLDGDSARQPGRQRGLC